MPPRSIQPFMVFCPAFIIPRVKSYNIGFLILFVNPVAKSATLETPRLAKSFNV